MSVMIGHASVSEKGTINGEKGDSTGKEVCTRTWYSKPWDYMAIHPDATVREKHAKSIEAACANDNIGYGQADRNTTHTEAKKVGYDLSEIKKKCNTDCSALQNLAAVASGARVTYGVNGWTTSTMLNALKAAGYKIITDKKYLTSGEYCVRGTIYVKAGSHTVCGLTDGSKASKTLKLIAIPKLAKATPNLKKGSTGTQVKHLQKDLNYLGFKGKDGKILKVDGEFGTNTEYALQAFQKKYKLTMDGVYNSKSRAKMKTLLV